MQAENLAVEANRGLSLRPVMDADEPFVRELYASTRSEELAMVPWNDEQRSAFIEMQFKAQSNHYQQHFPGATHEIIVMNGADVGRLYVQRLEREIEIMDLTILPRERNAGIGRMLMQEILEEAGQLGKSVGIYVETFNPSKRFFERLGFKETEQSGVHVHLQWFPPEINYAE